MDAEVRRAYAVLELTPPVGADTLRRQYRRLARRWHPDRHAYDPVAQADATDRMRRINDAFRLVAASLEQTPQHTPPAGEAPRPRWAGTRHAASRMSREEIEEMVASINRANEWTLWPRMSRDRWYSLGAVAFYFVFATVLPPAVGRLAALGFAFVWAALFLIWTADSERAQHEARTWFRRLGWGLMAVPAVTAMLAAIWP